MPDLAIAVIEVRLRRGDEEDFLGGLRLKFPSLAIQLVSAGIRPNPRRLDLIASQTARSMREGSLLADRPEMDLLLRVAGTTQITEAIRKSGYKKGGTMILVAIGPKGVVGKLQTSVNEKEVAAPRRRSALSSDDYEAIERAALLGSRRA